MLSRRSLLAPRAADLVAADWGIGHAGPNRGRIGHVERWAVPWSLS